MLATNVIKKVKVFLGQHRVQQAIKVFVGYTTLSIVFELAKQYMIWKHQEFLIKEDFTIRKEQETRRKRLRAELEDAVIKGDEADIDKIRKELMPYIKREKYMSNL